MWQHALHETMGGLVSLPGCRSQHILRFQGSVGAVFHFKDHGTAFQHLEGVPLAGGNVKAVDAVLGGDGELMGEGGVVVVKLHVDGAPQHDVSLGRVAVAVDGSFSSISMGLPSSSI